MQCSWELELIFPRPNNMINIIEKRNIPFFISGALVTASVVMLAIFGLKPGIDFTGGTLIQLRFTHERPQLSEMQEVMDDLDFGDIQVQPTDEKSYLLKMRFITENEHQQILVSVRDRFAVDGEPVPVDLVIDAKTGEQTIVPTDGGIDVSADSSAAPGILEDRVETIGPTISGELTKQSWQAAIAVIFAIVLFIAYSFRKVSKAVSSWKFGVTAVVALIHDVTITMGVFALLGAYMGVEVGTPFVVALLTILGYSVNDTIVVFDRIREKLVKEGSGRLAETVNAAINETIPRSINTSLTVLLVLSTLFLFGGDSIKYFAFALIVGITFGTYSSIFLASPLLVEWQKRK